MLTLNPFRWFRSEEPPLQRLKVVPIFDEYVHLRNAEEEDPVIRELISSLATSRQTMVVAPWRSLPSLSSEAMDTIALTGEGFVRLKRSVRREQQEEWAEDETFPLTREEFREFQESFLSIVTRIKTFTNSNNLSVRTGSCIDLS